MKKQLVLILFLLLFLAGCNPYSVDSLFSPPQIPQEFSQLNTTLSQIRSTGAEYVSPATGGNRQPVQLFDLDGDGEDECIAFFRNPEASDVVSVYLFEYADGAYWQCGTYQGKSAAIDSVTYADLLGNGTYELIVGWEMGGKQSNRLTVYRIDGETLKTVTELPYQYYLVGDLNANGVNNLGIVDTPVGQPNAQFSLYASDGKTLEHVAATSLGVNGAAVKRITKGKLGEDRAAVFVTSEYQGGFLTDLFISQGKDLQNAGVDALGKRAFCTYCAYPLDIDGDGVTEFAVDAGRAPEKDAEVWDLVWRAYDLEVGLKDKAYTQYCDTGNWYLTLPLDWKGSVTAQYRALSSTMTKVEFSAEGSSLFTLFVLTGEKRAATASDKGLIKLTEQGSTLYAAKLTAAEFRGVAITEDWLRTAFRLRENTWKTGDPTIQQ